MFFPFPFPFPILLRGACKRRWIIMSLQSEPLLNSFTRRRIRSSLNSGTGTGTGTCTGKKHTGTADNLAVLEIEPAAQFHH